MEVTPQTAPEAASSGARSLAEIGFAALLVATAVAVIATAASYPTESAAYPIAIGAGIAALGLWIGLRELIKRRRGNPTPGGFAEHGPRLAIGIATLVAYFIAVSLLGFILPSLALCILLPAAVGFRHWGLSVAVAVISVVFILLVFVYALERPIPPDILSPFLGRLR